MAKVCGLLLTIIALTFVFFCSSCSSVTAPLVPGEIISRPLEVVNAVEPNIAQGGRYEMRVDTSRSVPIIYQGNPAKGLTDEQYADAIKRAEYVGQGDKIWFIMIMICNRGDQPYYAGSVYYVPYYTTSQIRRGYEIWINSNPEFTSLRSSNVSRRTYAQVAPVNTPFDHRLHIPSVDLLPFYFSGFNPSGLDDGKIVAVVQFARTTPVPDSLLAETPLAIRQYDFSAPILAVERTKPGRYEIRTGRHMTRGCYLSVKETRHGYRITRLSFWIS